MSYVRSIAIWVLVPLVVILVATEILEGVSVGKMTMWILLIIGLLTAFVVDQAIERVRSPKLAALARDMGMQFDANLSWVLGFRLTSKFACLEEPTIPFLKACTGFGNIFVLNSEPAIFGCHYETGHGKYSTTIYRTIYRHKGEAILDTEKTKNVGWKIEIGGGYTIYYKEEYRAAPDEIREEYRHTRELHKTLLTE